VRETVSSVFAVLASKELLPNLVIVFEREDWLRGEASLASPSILYETATAF
jgi:hypothetical protein